MAAPGGRVQRDLRPSRAADFSFLFLRRQVPDFAAAPALLSVPRFQQLSRFHSRTCRGRPIHRQFVGHVILILIYAWIVHLSRNSRENGLCLYWRMLGFDRIV